MDFPPDPPSTPPENDPSAPRERVHASFGWVLAVLLVAVALWPIRSRFVHAGERDPVSASLSQQVGRMIVVGFRGTRLADTASVLTWIRRGKIGGVVLYDYDVPTRSVGRNITGPDQLRRLTGQLQRAADTPLLIGVDQEGGAVTRLKSGRGFSPLPSAEQLGRHDDLSTTRRVWRQTAVQLRDLGVNLNFAPVVDLNRNPHNPVIGAPGRSFSSDPEVVVRHARVVMRQLRRAGVIPTLKHFPGHGSSREDSHRGWVDVTETWSPVELRPYRRLLGGGGPGVVMVGHLFNRNWDPTWPATLSEAVVGGMLRNEVGFDGVVITDDLQMGAIRKRYSLRTVVRRALVAGVDLLMFANNTVYQPGVGTRVHDLILELVRSGTVPRRRIERSYRRIRELKRWLRRRTTQP